MKFKNKLMAAALALSFAIGSVSQAAPLSRKPQDNLFYATTIDVLGLDPALIDDGESANVVYNLYESLLRFKDGTTELEPCLAEKWDISEDGKVYTFYLRKGVKFHDGTPFNAEAVKFNFDRQSEAKRTPNMPYAPLVFGDVASTDVVDEYTVRVTLKRALTPFLRNMAMTIAASIASPTAIEKYGNNLNQNPCGTGPYKLVAWDKGEQLILTTFDDYWGKKPNVQNVIYKVIKEGSARVLALNNGEVDIMTGVDSNVIDQITGAGNIVDEKEGNNTGYLLFNHRKEAATSDREVRRAIAQAINVPKMVETLYKGYSSYANTYMPVFMSPYDPNHKQIQYNPEEAKKTLEAKGIKNIKIVVASGQSVVNSVGGQVLAEAVQDYLKQVGVNAEVIVYDFATMKAKLKTDAWDLSFISWIGDNGDPDNFINIFAAYDANINQGLWQNKEFIDIINKAVSVPDGKERDELYRRAEQIIVEDAGILPFYHAKTLIAYRPNIKNAEVIPMGMTGFSKIEKEVK